MLHLTVGALSLIVNVPVEVRQVQAPTIVVQANRGLGVFPSLTIGGSLLDDFADAQIQEDAKLEARRAAFKKAQAEQEAKAESEAAAAEAKAAEKLAKVEKLKAEAAAKLEAKAVASAEARKARETASTSAPTSKKATTVTTVNARAERIAARKASGEEGPTLFGL